MAIYRRSFAASVLIGLGSVLSCMAAHAQQVYTPDQLGLTGGQLDALSALIATPAASPGTSLGSPVAFGAEWGNIGIGIAGSTVRTARQYGFSSDADGSMGATVGLGNASKWVGLEANLNIISLRDNFGDDGNMNFKLHRKILGNTAVAIGVENVAQWGHARDLPISVYGVGTSMFSLGSPNALLAVNLGVGNRRFRKLNRTLTSNTAEGAGVFGGASLILFRRVSVIADWTGRVLNAGISVAPLRAWPLVISAGASNLTKAEVNGNLLKDEKIEFIGGIGYQFNF